MQKNHEVDTRYKIMHRNCNAIFCFPGLQFNLTFIILTIFLEMEADIHDRKFRWCFRLFCSHGRLSYLYTSTHAYLGRSILHQVKTAFRRMPSGKVKQENWKRDWNSRGWLRSLVLRLFIYYFSPFVKISWAETKVTVFFSSASQQFSRRVEKQDLTQCS